MELTPQRVFARPADAQIVDVRETDELAEGIIDGVVHIPLGAVPQSERLLDPARPVILVCRSGHRSASAATLLAAAGFDAHTMTGGMLEWVAEGLPTVAPHTS